MNTGPQHVSNGASSEIVNDEPTVFFAFSWPPLNRFTFNSLWVICSTCTGLSNEFAKTNGNTSTLPRLAKVPDGLALRVKNMWATKQSSPLRTFDDLQKFVFHWKQPAIFVLADL